MIPQQQIFLLMVEVCPRLPPHHCQEDLLQFLVLLDPSQDLHQFALELQAVIPLVQLQVQLHTLGLIQERVLQVQVQHLLV